MANYLEFTIEDSKFQEKKFIDSIKNNLYHNGIHTQNSVSQTGVVRKYTLGEGVEDKAILKSMDNPFVFRFPFSKFNVLGNFIGETKIENTKSAQKTVDNETLMVYSYVLKSQITFKAKKLIPIILAVLGILIGFSGKFLEKIFIFGLIIILWYIVVKIIGKINLKKGLAKLQNVFENYQDIV